MQGMMIDLIIDNKDSKRLKITVKEVRAEDFILHSLKEGAKSVVVQRNLNREFENESEHQVIFSRIEEKYRNYAVRVLEKVLDSVSELYDVDFEFKKMEGDTSFPITCLEYVQTDIQNKTVAKIQENIRETIKKLKEEGAIL